MEDGKQAKPNEEGTHPLDSLDDGDIKAAFTAMKVLHVLVALLCIAAGIIICINAKTPVYSSRGEYLRYGINGGMIALGVILMLAGPLLTCVSWIVFRPLFILIRDTNVIRSKVTDLEDLALLQAKKRDE